MCTLLVCPMCDEARRPRLKSMPVSSWKISFSEFAECEQ